MNYFKISVILLISSIFSMTSCTENTDKDVVNLEIITPSEIKEIPEPTNSLNQNPTTKEPAQNAAGVWHYTCSKGCAGGAGDAVNCNTCGNLLIHNAAYHPVQNTSTPGQNNAVPNQNVPEPAQNAAGVWHYTCQKGCPSGAGSALPCKTCGATLAHNAAYH